MSQDRPGLKRMQPKLYLIAALAGDRTVYLARYKPNVFGNWNQAIRFSTKTNANYALKSIPDGGLVVPEIGSNDSDISKKLIAMRKKNPSARKKNPDNEIRELILFAENEYSLQNQYDSIIKNLERKAAKGKYDPTLAPKLWKYWIDNAVKEYNFQFLSGKRSLVQNVFSTQDRKDAAIIMEQQTRDDILSEGNARKKNPVAGRSKGEPKNIYEIYTKHPTTGEGGWNIFFVRSTKENIKSFPLFDEIITINDYPMSGDRSGIVNWDGKRITKNPAARKKNPSTSNPYDGVGPHILFIFGKSGPVKFVSKSGNNWIALETKTDAHKFKSITAAQDMADRITTKKGELIGIMKASLSKKFADDIVKTSRSTIWGKA